MFSRLQTRYGDSLSPLESTENIQAFQDGEAQHPLSDVFQRLQTRYNLPTDTSSQTIQASPDSDFFNKTPSQDNPFWPPKPSTARQQPLELAHRKSSSTTADTDLIQRDPSTQTLAVEKKETPPSIRYINQALQRAEDGDDDDDDDQQKEMSDEELDDLARQIYPLIKRMISVERERRPGRSYF